MYLSVGFSIFEINSMVPSNESLKVNRRLENCINMQFSPKHCTNMTLFLWANLLYCQLLIYYAFNMMLRCANQAIKRVITLAVEVISRLLIQSFHNKQRKEMRKFQNASQIGPHMRRIQHVGDLICGACKNALYIGTGKWGI